MGNAGKRPWRKGLDLLFMFVGFGVIGYWVGKAGFLLAPIRGSFDALSGWDLLALPLIWLLVIAVHEAGHLAAGLARGMRFLIYIVGPFGWVRTPAGVRFRWFFNLGTLGGLAAALPDTTRSLRGQLVPLIVGGPLASLVLALAGGGLFVAADGRLGAYGLLVGAISALIFLVTIVPLRSGGFMSDGMQWRQAYRDPGMIARRTQLMALMGQGFAGTRPRDLDPQTITSAMALVGQEAVYDIGVWSFQYSHAMDRGDAAAAGLWLDRIEAVFDQYPDGFRQALALELAYFEARHRQRADVAESWLQRSRGGVVDPSRRALAQAAVAAAKGETASARSALARARAALGRGMDAGTPAMSADQIQSLEETLDARERVPA